MRNPQPIRLRVKPSEEGYLLLSVMFLLAILALWLAVAVPKMTRSIQRDRDQETMERGKQYIRAIQLYYRKFGAYPPSVDALVKTNDIRFLRKRYLDPTTGKDDWKPVLFGQNKVPTAMGFFGQPLSTGSSLAGIGPSGGNGMNGANGSATNGNFFGSNGGSGFGNSPGGLGNSSGGSIFGTSGNGANPAGGATDNSGSPGAGATGSSGTGGTNGSSDSGTTGTGLGGQTFGGAGMIGVSPASPKQSILVYKTKDHYNEWEFTYDPIMDRRMMTGGNTGTIGQPAGNQPGAVGIPGITAPGTGSSGTGNSGSSDNGTGGFGSSSGPPETPVPPQ
jgi:type II secretory pathway pseudopilin PulG